MSFNPDSERFRIRAQQAQQAKECAENYVNKPERHRGGWYWHEQLQLLRSLPQEMSPLVEEALIRLLTEGR